MKKLYLLLLLPLVAALSGCGEDAAEAHADEIYMYFSPDDKCDEQVIAVIDKAVLTLDVAVYSFNRQNIADAVLRARRRNVRTRVVFDEDQTTGAGSKDVFLEGNGVEVRRDKHSGYGAMHHKFAVIDGAAVITGSYNWTSNATSNNDENLVVVYSKKAAEQYRKEFERVWEHARQ